MYIYIFPFIFLIRALEIALGSGKVIIVMARCLRAIFRLETVENLMDEWRDAVESR